MTTIGPLSPLAPTATIVPVIRVKPVEPVRAKREKASVHFAPRSAAASSSAAVQEALLDLKPGGWDD